MHQEYKLFMGIDVSKATLDISFSNKHFKINNKPQDISSFIKEEILCKNLSPTLVCLESTGGYERVAIRCFQQAKIPIHRAHPNRVYAFAKASNHFAKTDKLDAQLLEKYAAFVSDKEKGDEVISDTLYELQELRRLERNLMEELHSNQCRLKRMTGKAVTYIVHHIDCIQQAINSLRQDIKDIIAADDQLRKKRDILLSYKGVAHQTANTFIAELPELGQFTDKEIASLVGVAPKTCESGVKKWGGHIRGGKFYVRKALYMAALVACRYDARMKDLYQRLIAAGKPKKVAVVAVMRKIIISLNAMIKNNMTYS